VVREYHSMVARKYYSVVRSTTRWCEEVLLGGEEVSLDGGEYYWCGEDHSMMAGEVLGGEYHSMMARSIARW